MKTFQISVVLYKSSFKGLGIPRETRIIFVPEVSKRTSDRRHDAYVISQRKAVHKVFSPNMSPKSRISEIGRALLMWPNSQLEREKSPTRAEPPPSSFCRNPPLQTKDPFMCPYDSAEPNLRCKWISWTVIAVLFGA